MSEDNPLLKALPPETDYITYLTILEYNLTKEQLPTLHDILQDTTLTSNIGWDLIHLLLPHLPESEQCLRDIAHLGNPREVILKVTESLEEIARDDDDVNEREEEEEEDKAHDGVGENQVDDNESLENGEKGISKARGIDQPSKESRFGLLLSLLAILLPRIKTKYASRFLSTTLQSVLSTYTSLSTSEDGVQAILKFTKRISGTKRPALPPRISSSSIATLSRTQTGTSAPDPEANADGIGAGEVELQKRLMQSFLTFVAEIYFSNLEQADEDAPGMSYAARYQELTNPEKQIPHRRTVTELFEEERYHKRDSNAGQILALGRDLGLNPEDLLATVLKATDPSTEEESAENELPSSASDVPLSPTGSLYLLSTSLATPLLFKSSPVDISLPDYSTLLLLHLPNPSAPSFATIPPPLLDTIFFLGSYILHTNPSISPQSDSSFTDSLQRLSLLSAQLPSPTQRYRAHTLSSTLLHLHSSNEVKLAYIKDTLEHCPYENLKASAVGWIKDEVLAANNSNTTPSANTSGTSEERNKSSEAGNSSGIFGTSSLFEVLSEFLWGDRAGIPIFSPSTSLEDQREEFAQLQSLEGFFLSVLNLLYLLVTNTGMWERYEMGECVGEIKEDFLGPLLETARGFEGLLAKDEEVEGQDPEDVEEEGIRKERIAVMQLLGMNCLQVLDGIERREKG